MFRVKSNRGFLIRSALLLACAALVVPVAAAQSTGLVRGKVLDNDGKPIEGAQITIEFQEGNRKYESQTNRNGEFVQIGLPPGVYNVTAEKPGVGAQRTQVRVTLGGSADVNFKMSAAAAAAAGPDPEKIEALKKGFEEGVALSRSGDYDGAIAKFNQTATDIPGCYDCYYNIGLAYAQKKDYAQAETAFKQAIELKPDYAEAFNGLATVYNQTKRFDEAAEASAKAVEMARVAAAAGGGGASADSLYNQGVIFWNAGKIAEAKAQFEEVIKMNPNHADAHFQLGMALLNEGKMAEAVTEFETSVQLSPSGPNAAQAKALLAQLKQ